MTAQKKLYIHLGGRFPFPVNPFFFGQTFVIGNHTICSRLGGRKDENVVAFRNGNMRPIFDDPLNKQSAERVAKGKFNSALIFDYEGLSPEGMATLIQRKMLEGFTPVVVSHYAISNEIEYAAKVREEVKRRNLIDQVVFIAYQHTELNLSRNGNGKGLSTDTIIRYIGETCDAIITVSDAVKEGIGKALRRVFGNDQAQDRLVTVRNGIDPITYAIYDKTLMSVCRRSIGISDSVGTLFGFSGRLDKIKGSDLLLAVIEHFNKSRDSRDRNIGFAIATPHVLMPEIGSSYFKRLLGMQRLIEEGRLRIVLDVSKFVRRDERYHGDVARLIRAFSPEAIAEFERLQIFGGIRSFPVQAISDVVIHPSRTEGLPLAVLEALFSGAFVLGSAVGGIPEVVTPSTGILLPPPNDLRTLVPQYLDHMRACAGSPGTREPPTGLDEFTDMVMFGKLEQVVNEAILRRSVK